MNELCHLDFFSKLPEIHEINAEKHVGDALTILKYITNETRVVSTQLMNAERDKKNLKPTRS